MASRSPLQLWTIGMLQLPQRQRPLNRVSVQPPFAHQWNVELRPINPFTDDGNHGIELFVKACELLERQSASLDNSVVTLWRCHTLSHIDTYSHK